jgi:HD-GYP domain-containing protein (c-di-GMP phosphodiesterase class II)
MGAVLAVLGKPRASVIPASLLLLAALGGVMVWLLANPAYNPMLVIVVQHFYIVTLVAAVTLILAVVVARVAVQIEHYKALFLALGFMTMAGIFMIHGFSTPGVIVGVSIHTPSHGVPLEAVGGVISLSAFLSLFVPSIFFALAYSPIGTPFEHRLPFRATALVIGVLTALVVYAALALGTPLLALSPLSKPLYSYAMASITVVLLLWCAWQQSKPYRATHLPVLGVFSVGYLYLALAQIGMVMGTVFTLAWWMYHFFMLVAVTLCLGTLLLEYSRGRPLRRIFEGALGLRVEVGAELEHVEAITALAAATELKDPYTKGHTVRVAELAVAIGQQMNVGSQVLRVLARAGLLHDIGKLAIPDAVLLKPGPLDKDEWAIMQTHPQLGLDMVAHIGRLRRESQVLSAHHEKMDGSGYLNGLAGEEIPLEARIISVADTYDALVTDRPYRKGMAPEAAMRIVREESGAHLYSPAVDALEAVFRDPEMVERLAALYGHMDKGTPIVAIG